MHRRVAFITNTADVFSIHQAKFQELRLPMALLFSLTTQLCMENLMSSGQELVPGFYEYLVEDEGLASEPWYPNVIHAIEQGQTEWLVDFFEVLLRSFRYALRQLPSHLEQGFFFSGIRYVQLLGCDAQFEMEISGSRVTRNLEFLNNDRYVAHA